MLASNSLVRSLFHYTEQRCQLCMGRSSGEVHLRLCPQGGGIKNCDAMPMDSDQLFIYKPVQNSGDDFAH